MSLYMSPSSTRLRPAALAAFTGAIFATTVRTVSAQPAAPPAAPASIIDTLTWRSIGPDRGGRSIAVSGVKGRPNEAYFGAVGGGLWKTTDGGENWLPVTDGQITSASVGAVAVSESNPDVLFIGMGEACIRGNIMPGDGVYKSSDAGRTWTHVGFRESQAISRVRIHPTNPDIVFVASFGKYGAPSAERGVFKSTDGGRTWKKTLFRDEKTGAVDLSIDPKNPDVIYAALWEAYRVEYQMSSGGPGSGLFKSIDGGETWSEITRNTGLPAASSAASASPSPARIPTVSTRSSRTRAAGSSRQTMRGKRGRSSTATGISASARSTTRTSPPIRSAATRSIC
jgi:hypothetical protein